MMGKEVGDRRVAAPINKFSHIFLFSEVGI